MSTYRLTLDVDLDCPATDDLVGKLAEVAGIASVEPSHSGVSLTLTAEGATPADALAGATNRTLTVVNSGSGGPGEVIFAEICTEAEGDRRRADATFPELVGIAEIADLLKITRQRASALQTRAGFPLPVAQLRSGPVWRLSDLSAFATTWDHSPYRPAESSTTASPPIDVGKLIGALNSFNPNPVARNAIKLARWYAKRPKG